MVQSVEITTIFRNNEMVLKSLKYYLLFFIDFLILHKNFVKNINYFILFS